MFVRSLIQCRVRCGVFTFGAVQYHGDKVLGLLGGLSCSHLGLLRIYFYENQ